jgi:hypothetical protein
MQNGAETGVDCGGPCMPCTCFNGVLDDNEDCIDCGGDCGPCRGLSGRYIDPVFNAYDVTNILYYGHGIVEPNGRRKYLSFKFYEPSGDTALIRPLVIFIGQTTYAENADGSFFSESINYRDNFMEKGYVVADIIGIRFWEGIPPLPTYGFNQAAMLIQEDIKGAVRYFKKNAKTFRVDTSNIWLMGASMGAMAALHAAYLDESDYDEIDPDLVAYIKNDPGVEGDFDYRTLSSAVKGVIILSGMIFDIRMIDQGEPYLFSLMGKEDAYRPFQCENVKVNWIQEEHLFCGPEAMKERMEETGFHSEDYRFEWIGNPPADHMAPFEYQQCPDCADQIISFVADRLGYCPEIY